MDYKNDTRTPRDRVTGEFLSELLFTDLGGECDCGRNSMAVSSNRVGSDRRSACDRDTLRTAERTAPNCNNCKSNDARRYASERNGVEITGDYSLAMAYVPMQIFGELFDIEEGFCHGTIFRDLKFPFYPTPCRKESD